MPGGGSRRRNGQDGWARLCRGALHTLSKDMFVFIIGRWGVLARVFYSGNDDFVTGTVYTKGKLLSL